jgi:geranylgeranyl diphosphate synthase type I
VTRTPGRALPPALAQPARLVDARLRRLFHAEVDRWVAVDPDLRPALAALGSMVLSGGKRLRPAFCYWSYVGCGGDPDEPLVIDAGAALEMLHAAALVHDDIIDGSARRHGLDTVHVQYAARHQAAAWRGDSARFGAGVGIILGDVALVYSDHLLAAAPPAARVVFDEARLEVNLGQYLDIVGGAQGLGRLAGPAGPGALGGPGEPGGAAEGDPAAGDPAEGDPAEGDPAVGRAQRICRYKTAKYTVERPLHLGAALGAPERYGELAGPLSAVGLPLGEAFQLQDDLLGVFGDPEVTGKPVGDDLREGKLTLLATLAWARARGAEARLLQTRFGAPDLSPAEVVELRAAIEATGARQDVEATIDRLADRAEVALAALSVRPEAREALRQLAEFVTGRDH